MDFSALCRDPHNTVNKLMSKYTVNLFIDADGFTRDSNDNALFDNERATAASIIGFARGFGAVTKMFLYVRKVDADLLDERAWGRRYHKRIVTEDDITEVLSLDLLEQSLLAKEKTVYCLIGYTDQYYEVVRRVASAGNVVVLVYTEVNKIAAPLHDLIVHVDLNNVLGNTSMLEQKDQGTAENKDHDDTWRPSMDDFIWLLNETEQRLPFVGVGFFVSKTMTRAGMGSIEECQALFKVAKDQGYVELGSSRNIKNGEPDVTTCKLSQDHPTVADALQRAREGIVTDDVNEEQNTENEQEVKEAEV